MKFKGGISGSDGTLLKQKKTLKPLWLKGSDHRQRPCFGTETWPLQKEGEGKKRKKRLGDAFHVLNSGGEEGLLIHIADSEHASIAQAMQLFGFCEGTFDCFLAPRVPMARTISTEFFPSFRTVLLNK